MEEFKLELDRNEENAVLYEVHPAAAEASAQQLQDLRDKVLDLVAPFCEGYIWQRDSFALYSSTDLRPPWKPESQPRAHGKQSSNLRDFAVSDMPLLWGSTRFGDNLEDEWFITWLLLEITRCLPGTVARVWDNDGEFLLIEAAYALLKWLKPETATNRVWLRDGLLHIAPLPTAAAPDIPSFLSLKQARQIVQGDQIDTLAAPKMRQAIAARLKGYPQKAHRQMQRTRVIAPARVAAVLHEDPNLAGPAVEAFYNRDVDDMRAVSCMRHFAPQDMMSVVVTLNRCMYAQLEQQEFEAPVGFSMPPAMSAQHSAAQRGMKLTCGFEMLSARRSASEASDRASQAKEGSASREPAYLGAGAVITERDVSAMPAWHAYKAGLARKGYFKENIPGSQQYKQLLQQALQAFVQSPAYRQAVAAAQGPASRIDTALQSHPIQSAEEQHKLEEAMQGAEDDDSWMRDGADDLERELAAREREMRGEQAASSGTGFDPDTLAQQFKAFVEKESGVEGAELPSAGAPAKREGEVSMDHKRFWRELGTALGMQPGDSDVFLKDMESDSNDEGSSFFGDTADEADSDNEDVGISQQDTVSMAQHAQRAVQGASAGPTSAAEAPPPDGKPTPGAQAKQQQKRSSATGFAFRFPSAPKTKPGTTAGSSQPAGEPFSREAPTASAAAPLSEGTAPLGAETAQQPATAAVSGGQQKQQEAEHDDWEALTATDSDDEFGQAGSPDFMSQYAAAMEAELGQSKIGDTFSRPKQEGGEAAAKQEQELQPVDLDVNLVENLLASYAGQQGLPGPASNLAGLMGISLPDNKDNFA